MPLQKLCFVKPGVRVLASRAAWKMEKIAEKAISSDYHFFPGKEWFLVLHPGHLMSGQEVVGAEAAAPGRWASPGEL